MKASITGKGCGEKDMNIVENTAVSLFQLHGVAAVLLEAGGEQALKLDVHAGGAEGGVAVVEQESADEVIGFGVGELAQEERGSYGSMHPGIIAE